MTENWVAHLTNVFRKLEKCDDKIDPITNNLFCPESLSWPTRRKNSKKSRNLCLLNPFFPSIHEDLDNSCQEKYLSFNWERHGDDPWCNRLDKLSRKSTTVVSLKYRFVKRKLRWRRGCGKTTHAMNRLLIQNCLAGLFYAPFWFFLNAYLIQPTLWWMALLLLPDMIRMAS